MKRILSTLTDMWKWVRPHLFLFTTSLGKAMLQIATEYMHDAMQDPALDSPEARRQYVFARLRDHEITTGNGVTDTILYLVILEAERRYGR
jgi:hypothetical protein